MAGPAGEPFAPPRRRASRTISHVRTDENR
jgi:hypothetical protein